MYYNTNEETGNTLTKSRKKTVKQADLILDIFKKHSIQSFTPEEIRDILEQNRYVYPITSVRRAITDLTSEKKLVKTDIMRMGTWNKLTHAWKLK